MSDNRPSDEELVMDCLLGRLPASQEAEVRARIAAEAPMRRLRDDVAATLSALALLESQAPPAGLADRTVDRVRRYRRAQAEMAREEMHRQRFFRPTFSLKELGALAAAALLAVCVLVPTLQKGRQARQLAQCQANAGLIGSGLHRYAGDNEQRLPCASGDGDRWLPGGTEQAARASNSAAGTERPSAKLAGTGQT